MRTAGLVASLACFASLVSASTIHIKQKHRGAVSQRRHQAAAAEVEEAQNVTSRNLERRFGDARFTFYDAGLGACGKVNSGSDFIVALNAAQYDGGSHCFQEITITVGSKSHSAQIVDECPGCPFGGLDFSRGLFDFFASEDVGVLTGSWEFGGGGGSAPPPPPPPPPPKHTTTTHAAPPPPPPTHTTPPPPPPPPKTTATPHTSSSAVHQSSSAVHSSSSASSVSVTASSSAARGSASVSSSLSAAGATATSGSSSTGDDTDDSTGNIAQMYLAFVQIGSMITTGDEGSSSSA